MTIPHVVHIADRCAARRWQVFVLMLLVAAALTLSLAIATHEIDALGASGVVSRQGATDHQLVASRPLAYP